MRYFWTVFWTFLLIQMLVYVAGSMVGVAYDFQIGIVITIAASVLIFIVPLVLPDGPAEERH